MKVKLLLLLNLFILSNCALPVAVFHGLGDDCIFPGMKSLSNYFSKQLNTYSRCIETGGNVLDWFTSFQTQAHKGCEAIKKDKNFHGEFSVVGLSQGSLLARYIIETCDMPGKVKNYISIGGPQMGVAKFPHCSSGPICDLVNGAVGKAIYFSLVQNHIGPAGYFKTHYNIPNYLSFSSFLADLNNEKEIKNEEYKRRMLDLNKVLLIKFSEDTMIIPRETAHFEFYDKEENVELLTNSEFYKKDFIGLRALVEQKKVIFEEIKGDHLDFTYKDIDNLMIPILK